MAPSVGYAIARATIDASELKIRESFMFQLRGVSSMSTLSVHYIGIGSLKLVEALLIQNFRHNLRDCSNFYVDGKFNQPSSLHRRIIQGDVFNFRLSDI